jgi:uncharacterized membrane protein YfcA
LDLLPDLPAHQYAIALLGAFALGISKTGFPGLAMLNVLIMAELFGAKASVGIVLPLLVVCDLLVYPLFRRHASWRAVLPLLPGAIGGVVIGYFLLGRISDEVARRAIGGIILFLLVLQIARTRYTAFLTHLPDSRAFLGLSSLTIGISTMLANAAGPVYSLYALVHRMPKNEFLGIGARFFLFMNVFKLPFNTDLGIINSDSLRIDLGLLPGILAGILLGRKLISRVPQHVFEILLYAFSAIAAIRFLFF